MPPTSVRRTAGQGRIAGQNTTLRMRKKKQTLLKTPSLRHGQRRTKILWQTIACREYIFFRATFTHVHTFNQNRTKSEESSRHLRVTSYQLEVCGIRSCPTGVSLGCWLKRLVSTCITGTPTCQTMTDPLRRMHIDRSDVRSWKGPATGKSLRIVSNQN